MKRVMFFLVVLGFSACAPQNYCESIALDTKADALPLAEYALDSQGATFDRLFTPSHWIGPQEYRCCFGARGGKPLAACPTALDCTAFEADVKMVKAPFSGSQHLGAYFCQAAVRENKVVSVWGQYND